MRLGGNIFEKPADPDAWVQAVKKAGYRAAYCPIGPDAGDDVIRAYAKSAAGADIVIAEVGAWSNPIHPDEAVRKRDIEKCIRHLELAEKIGARCCVNIAGSRGEKWDGPCADDLTEDTFALIVDSVREIIDAVRPSRSFYTLETMPWMYPDSADSYLELIRAIDRKAFAVHLDPVNLVNCPSRYFATGVLIREAFAKLGRFIRSCHGKDILLGDRLTVHLDEVPPGKGGLDYSVYLEDLAKLDPDTPLMLEHMKREEYPAAAAFVKGKAAEIGVAFKDLAPAS